jgi:para-aminobenzoate synthetase / 4-amino-4-deoxychorismate lyase
MMAFDPTRAFVWFEDSRGPTLAGPSWLFQNPKAVETAPDGNIHAAFDRLRAASSEHLWLAGWLAYEAGYRLEPKLKPCHRPADSLMWMGQFQDRVQFDPGEVEALWRSPVPTPVQYDEICVQTRDITKAQYGAAIDRILYYILAGDVYQINFTFPLDVSTQLSPLQLFRQVRESQRVAFAAIIHDGLGNWILSFSPELFFRIDDGIITAKPMKGTAPRHNNVEVDKMTAETLQQDSKNRAENLMIVDLLRNDISRVARPGTVTVTDLFSIETYATVHQMTSTVSAELLPGVGPVDALAALFPCGSVTGAPKIRAMEIIREIESQPRGVYCGAIGWIAPDGDACFNVPIRTLQVNALNAATMGIGSGIVADSDAATEWQECIDKSAFLSIATPQFDLFETMRWSPDVGYTYLEEHFQRLALSAANWGFPADPDNWRHEAFGFAENLSASARVRFMLSRSGATSWQASPLTAMPDLPVILAISPSIMHRSNSFLYHKTSNRAFYDDERQRLSSETGCYECLFQNELGEITEGSFTTLFIKKRGKLFTPELACGVLPGILRQSFIANDEAEEAVLTLSDLQSADALYIGNSVRGLMRAELRI